MNNLFDAFISYGRADSKAFATKLYARLLEQGLKVWFDQNDIPRPVSSNGTEMYAKPEMLIVCGL
jgi:hypothetical protein